ncbi:MAG: sensor histidine kinase [Chthoniobacteraceae bacterium]
MSERGKTWRSTLLVFVPLLLLAALGIQGLQMSKHAAREAAERDTARAVRRAGELMEQGIADVREAPTPVVYPLPPVPAFPSPALELYEQARAAASVEESRRLLDQAQQADPYALSASGLPLASLIEWERLQKVPEEDLPTQIEAFAQTIVATHPSILTPEWLQRAASLLGEKGHDAQLLDAWQARWRTEEQVRVVLRKNAVVLDRASAPVWIQGEGQRWRAERAADSKKWRLISLQQLQRIAGDACRAASTELPPYATFQATLDTVALLPVRTGETLARSDAGPFLITGILHDADTLYAQQRQQTLWLAALLGCTILTAAAGTWLMHSSLQQERHVSALKSDFVSSISHELRAPVASIRIMAENLANGIVADESGSRKYHRLIADECSRLGTLIENVLDLARIERHAKSYHFAEVDLPALMEDAVRLLHPRAQQKRQELRITIDPIDPPPVCDGLAIQQALINLLDNAIKFAPEETVIITHATSDGTAHWLLEVVDEGPGIPDGEQAKIFDRFYRIGSELCRETRGTGIGLTIVKHIAEGHGGSVSIANEPSGGARFTLRLPMRPYDQLPPS